MTVNDIAVMQPAEIVVLPEMKRKVVENVLRRAARRQGLEVQRNRTRDARREDFGLYRMADALEGTIVAGGDGMTCQWSLPQVAAYLARRGVS